MMKALKIAYRNVLRNKRRATTTILLTAVGVSAMLIGGGFVNFTYVSLKEMAVRDSGNLVLSTQDFVDKQEEVPLQYGLENYKAIAKQIKKHDEVRYAIPKIEFSGLISNGDKSSIFVGSGVDPKGEFKVKGPFLALKSGSVLSKREKPENPQMLIGKELAKIMNAKVGSSLTLMSSTVDGGLNALDITVQGIVSTGVPDMDKRLVIVNIRTAQELLVTDKVSTLSIYLRNMDQTDPMKMVLENELQGYAWTTWLEKAFYYKGVSGIYDRIFGLLGIIMLIMVFFAISNTVSMSVVERTREIGTLRAIGTYSREILKNFMLEGLVIGVLGSLVGMLIGLSVSFLSTVAGFSMPPPPGRAEGYPLVISAPLDIYMNVSITIVVVCVLAAWLASWKAVNKTIVEALAHV
jgi:putative ABC transport system permease protein